MSEGRNKEELKDITLLGNQNNQYHDQYKPEVLEVFDNKHQGRDYFVKF
ncbi:NADPH-dependent 7-cyano-7-deazaguanine reductase QueF, partial [Mammaliicoccus fleurettii]|nr:NADPH-dependent 7-cyano-7-deazaguanine reductase QueF [Mammaliicoccus fleurettii]